LLRSYGWLPIRGDNRFEEILEQKDYLLRNWGWQKKFKKDKVKQPMENRVQSADWRKNRAVNEIRRWSERSTLTVGQQVRVIGRWQTRGLADGHEEGGIQRNTPDGKYGGGGSIHSWQRVKS
jgi:hypothetical protein